MLRTSRASAPAWFFSTLALALALPSHAQLTAVVFDLNDGDEKVLHVGPNSGELATPPGGVNTIANCCSFPGSVSTHDAAGQRLFFVAEDSSAVERLYVVNATTGAVITSPSLLASNVYDYLEYVAPNVYVVYHTFPGFEFRLATVDTTSGALTNVGDVIGDSCCSPMTGLSSAGGGFFRFVSSKSAVNEPRIWTLSLATGALEANPVLPPATQYLGLLRHPVTGALFMFTRGASGAQLTTVDPTTGSLTNVGSATAGCCNGPQGPLFGYGGVFYFVGANDITPPKRFFRINPSSGQITTFDLSTSFLYSVFEAVSFLVADGFESGDFAGWSTHTP